MVEIRLPIQEPTQPGVRELRLLVEANGLKYQRSWYLKTQRSIRPVVSMPQEFQSGQCMRDKPEEPIAPQSGALVHFRQTACGDVSRQALFMHPPYKTGVGYAWAVFGPLELPKTPPAMFRCQIGKADGSDPGDGILFRVAVIGPDGRQTTAAEKHWTQQAWTPLEADLSAWAGQRIRLKLLADVGPANNSSGDWAAWADLRIETAQPVLWTSLHDRP